MGILKHDISVWVWNTLMASKTLPTHRAPPPRTMWPGCPHVEPCLPTTCAGHGRPHFGAHWRWSCIWMGSEPVTGSVCVWWLQGMNLQDFQQSLYDFNDLDKQKESCWKILGEAQEALRFSTWNLFEKKQLKAWWMKLMIVSFQCWGHGDSGFQGPKTPPKLRCLL